MPGQWELVIDQNLTMQRGQESVTSCRMPGRQLLEPGPRNKRQERAGRLEKVRGGGCLRPRLRSLAVGVWSKRLYAKSTAASQAAGDKPASARSKLKPGLERGAEAQLDNDSKP